MDYSLFALIASHIVALFVGLILANFLPGYLGEKGKNLATKEDIEEITEKIESVKATISQRLQLSQFRYQKEFEILSELSAKTVDLRDATTSLRPTLDLRPNLPEEEIKKQRYERWFEAARSFYFHTERVRPFYPEEIYQAVKALEKHCLKESNRFRIFSGDPKDRNYDPKYWEEASNNAAEIEGQAGVVLNAIRTRTQKWEEFDENK
jgi:hypothetical protein